MPDDDGEIEMQIDTLTWQLGNAVAHLNRLQAEKEMLQTQLNELREQVGVLTVVVTNMEIR